MSVLGTFCREFVPDFTPMGGNRQDCAVVGCAFMLIHHFRDEFLPGDVLENILAMLCAPFVIRDMNINQVINGQIIDVPYRCNVRIESAGGLSHLCSNMWREASITPWRQMEYGIHVRMQLGAQLDKISDRFLYRDDITQLSMSASAVSVENAFLAHCTCLTRLTLPHTLTEVGAAFLYACQSLQELDLRSTKLTRVGIRFLYGCSSLAQLMLPDSLTEIGDMFAGECYSLKTLDARSATQLSHIGSSFMAECLSLSFVALPKAVTVVGDRFLFACQNLKTVHCEAEAVQAVLPTKVQTGATSLI